MLSSTTSTRPRRGPDLGYGGIAVETPEPLGSNFQAVLHVPILPPVRVSLRKLYELPTTGGQFRVGCAFII
jgi:hypothetical protein